MIHAEVFLPCLLDGVSLQTLGRSLFSAEPTGRRVCSADNQRTNFTLTGSCNVTHNRRSLLLWEKFKTNSYMLLNGFGAKSLLIAFKNCKYLRDVCRKHSCFPSQTAGFAVLLPRGQSNSALASIINPPADWERFTPLTPCWPSRKASPDIIALMHLEAFSVR